MEHDMMHPVFYRRTLLALALLVSSVQTAQVMAQSAAAAAAQAAAAADPEGAARRAAASKAKPLVPRLAEPVAASATPFYAELGGTDGVKAIVDAFVRIMLDDTRINSTFKDVDMDRLREKLAEQFCQVSGGGCTYTGKSMAESHEDMKITRAHFSAAVEDLQMAMDRRGVPTRVQNRLLARLAPTQRDIVTK